MSLRVLTVFLIALFTLSVCLAGSSAIIAILNIVFKFR